MTAPPFLLTRRGFAVLAAGFAAYTLYGSLVPFQYEPRPLGDAFETFAWAMQARAGVVSRSDYAANILLGVPVGFFLTAAVRADRPGGRWGDARAGLGVVPAVAGYAAAVEFAQLFFRDRMCTGADVIAQAVGAAVGVTGWVAVGPAVTAAARRAWVDPRTGGWIGHVLIAYLGLIALARWLPLDLSSEAGFYYWRRYKERYLGLIPFEELFGGWSAAVPDPAAKVRSWALTVGLFVPAGLLAAQLPRRGWWPARRPVAAVVVFAGAVELVRLGVASVVPSTTNVVLGTAGFAAGLGAATRAARGVRPWMLAGCLAAPLVAAWFPFDFLSTLDGDDGGDWTPFADLHRMNPAFALEAAIHRTALYLPLGALVAAVGAPWAGWRRPALAAVAGAVAAGGLDLGKLFLPGREPAATTVLLAAAGATVGAVVAGRVRLSKLFVARVVP